MTQKQIEEYKKCKECKICNSTFTPNNIKVRHHNHNTGDYISPLCNNCNIQIKAKIVVLVLIFKIDVINI